MRPLRAWQRTQAGRADELVRREQLATQNRETHQRAVDPLDRWRYARVGLVATRRWAVRGFGFRDGTGVSDRKTWSRNKLW